MKLTTSFCIVNLSPHEENCPHYNCPHHCRSNRIGWGELCVPKMASGGNHTKLRMLPCTMLPIGKVGMWSSVTTDSYAMENGDDIAKHYRHQRTNCQDGLRELKILFHRWFHDAGAKIDQDDDDRS